MSALTVSQLTVYRKKTSVLVDVSLDVPPGRLVAIMGPNGAGKSTLIQTLLGLVKPVSGRILLLNSPLKKVRQRISYIPQRESVDWDFPLTLYELVLMGRYGHLGLCSFPKKEDREKALFYLRKVGLEEYADRQISQLSGGQQQRAFLARGLAQEADLYFLDEPFSGIDIASSKVVFAILQELKEQGKSLFVVHHDLQAVNTFFDYGILLNMRLIAAGEIATVLTEDNLEKAYGKDPSLWAQVTRLRFEKERGYA